MSFDDLCELQRAVGVRQPVQIDAEDLGAGRGDDKLGVIRRIIQHPVRDVVGPDVEPMIFQRLAMWSVQLDTSRMQGWRISHHHRPIFRRALFGSRKRSEEGGEPDLCRTGASVPL